jgi:hypothetical protein
VATAATFFLGPGFIDGYRSPAHILAVEGGDGRFGFLLAAHLNEAEPFGLSGGAIRDDLGRANGAMRCE